MSKARKTKTAAEIAIETARKQLRAAAAARAKGIKPGAAERLELIAIEVLDLETLETRRMGSLDFHTLAVWQIKDALEQAYEAGRQSARPT